MAKTEQVRFSRRKRWKRASLQGNLLGIRSEKLKNGPGPIKIISFDLPTYSSYRSPELIVDDRQSGKSYLGVTKCVKFVRIRNSVNGRIYGVYILVRANKHPGTTYCLALHARDRFRGRTQKLETRPKRLPFKNGHLAQKCDFRPRL